MATRKKIDVAKLIDKMKLEIVAVDSLTPYARNPRDNDGAVDAVANSIQQFGWRVPLVIHGADNEIVNGHTRFKAAKKLGLERVPCLRADELTEQEIKALRLADNKVSELAKWDTNLLDLELGELADFGLDMSGLGFGDVALGGEEDSGSGEASASEAPNEAENYNITYQIVFDDETQQTMWFEFLRRIKTAYGCETIAENITRAITEWGKSRD